MSLKVGGISIVKKLCKLLYFRFNLFVCDLILNVKTFKTRSRSLIRATCWNHWSQHSARMFCKSLLCFGFVVAYLIWLVNICHVTSSKVSLMRPREKVNQEMHACMQCMNADHIYSYTEAVQCKTHLCHWHKYIWTTCSASKSVICQKYESVCSWSQLLTSTVTYIFVYLTSQRCSNCRQPCYKVVAN